MTNVLLTDLALSIPLKFFFESFIDKYVWTSVDSTIYWQYTSETFHLPLLFELLPSSEPGHKKFSKLETGSMFSPQKNSRKMCIADVSIVIEEYLGFSQWLWFSNCLQTSNSINLKGCIKTCKYFILTIKENCQMENYGKFGKKLLL